MGGGGGPEGDVQRGRLGQRQKGGLGLRQDEGFVLADLGQMENPGTAVSPSEQKTPSI